MDIVLLWAGLLFVAFGIMIIRSARSDEAQGHSVDGEVIGYAARGSNTFAPVVLYRDAFSRFVIETPLASNTLPYATGARVRVLVTPGDPPHARVSGPGINRFGEVFVVVGALLTILFFSLFQWTVFSVGVAVVVSIALAVQVRRVRQKMPQFAGIASAMRQATTAVAVPESQFDRSKLMTAIDVDARRARQPRQALIGGAIVLLIAAGCLTWSVLWTQRRSAFLARAVAAEGTVVELAASRDSDSTTWAPVVEFTPNGAAWPVRFKHPVSSSRPLWHVGQRVRVLHDPSEPQNAMIDSGMWNRGTPLLPGGIGALLALGGIAGLRSGLRRG